MTISARLKELSIDLPVVAKPVAAYVPARYDEAASVVRTSGQLPFINGELPALGKVGAEVSSEEAYTFARQAALNALAAAASVAGGVDSITGVRHVTVFVSSAPDFYAQPLVANGASEILGEIFGEAGAHTRSAVGVAVLPLNSPVEVEVEFATA